MNVLLIYSIFLVNFAFTGASTNGSSASVKIPSLYEMTLSSVIDQLPETSDYSAIQLVLELQVSVPSLPDGSNILHFASKKRKVGLMRVSIDSGRFDINAVDVDGFTALHHVCNGTENPEMAVDAAKLLVESGANIDSLYAQNLTSLHFSVLRSNFELVEYLLSLGAQTEFQDSILGFAMSRCNDPRIIKALIEKNPSLLEKVEGFLHFASIKRMIDLMRIAIDYGRFDINEVDIKGFNKFTALHKVCIGKENPEMAVDAAKILVENGANINALDYWNNSPLHSAVEKSNFELVEYFLSVGAQTEFQDSILEFAMYRGTDSRIVKALIEKNPRLIESAKELLLLASHRRMIDLMRIAINSKKFGTNKVHFNRSTALHYVCRGTENPEMAVEAAKILVENGAKIEALDSQNSTPLHYAVRNSNIELVEYLKSKGAR
jgi:ankyrin repeat protein